MKTRNKIALAAFITLVVGIVMYTTLPFPKFGQIHVFRADITPEDKKGIFIDRLYAYNHYIYVHKGMSFREIPCYSDDGSKHILDIKFNWDNSISISEKDHKTILHIDSVSYERELSYGIGYLVGDEYIFEDVPDEAFFESISFHDSQQICDSVPYTITLLRQKRSLPNGPKRYGFELYIDNKRLITGKGDRPFFNY
jgi:hypothetical protein